MYAALNKTREYIPKACLRQQPGALINVSLMTSIRVYWRGFLPGSVDPWTLFRNRQ